MKKLYYFAHPYSGNEAYNYFLCNKRVSKLINLGHAIFSPITHSHPLATDENRNDHDLWLKLDFIIMDCCGAVIFAPEWEHPKGCVLEMKRAVQRKQQILFYPDFLNTTLPEGEQ